jgi:glucose/arabinose dehydrogenase
VIVIFALLITIDLNPRAQAQTSEPTMVDTRLAVRQVVNGLMLPTNFAFINRTDILAIEKNTGKVILFAGGATPSPVLDLAVNFFSERGLLGLALHPDFQTNHWVYLYWTESKTGVDTNVPSETPDLGNRVDRYLWDGAKLVFQQNLIQIRAIQADAGQPERGNHDGGVLAFGKDKKLFIFVGDLGRRG